MNLKELFETRKALPNPEVWQKALAPLTRKMKREVSGWTWTTGGCFAFAEAFKKAFGGEYYGVCRPYEQDGEIDYPVDHALVKLRGVFYDYNGIFNPQSIASDASIKKKSDDYVCWFVDDFLDDDQMKFLQDTMKRCAMVNEAYSAGGYSTHAWTRWWGNLNTGKLIEVPLTSEHDPYFFDHLELFFTQEELNSLPHPDDPQPHEDEIGVYPRDTILEAAYRKGWITLLLDGNKKTLYLNDNLKVTKEKLRNISEMVSSISSSFHFDHLGMVLNQHTYDLDEDQIELFIKYGKLPK